MSKKRKIYKGFNKRREIKIVKSTITTLCICLILGYGYIRIKDSEIFTNNIFTNNKILSNISNKILSLENFKEKKSEVITNDDIADELNQINKSKEETSEETLSIEQSDKIQVAIIDGWNVYTIQVASVENENDIEIIEKTLTNKKIPFSTVEIDKLKKVQTYIYFNPETTRNYLESVREVYEDAFISEMKMPTLSLEYTNKYSYVEIISGELNKLVTNFKGESEFWSKDNKDMESYNEILTERRKIIQSIEKEAKNIDYKDMQIFRQNLLKYTEDIDENIDIASKSANEQLFDKSQSLLISSIQGYYTFINSIKEA